MNKAGPIIIIEDDEDDRTMILEIFKKSGYSNPVICFSNGNTALEHLHQTEVHPFLILSDINMPVMDGLQVRNQVYMNEHLRHKCIPYLFFTTADNPKVVDDAYALSAHGYFVKPSSYTDFEATLKSIVDYWLRCVAPTRYNSSQYLTLQ